MRVLLPLLLLSCAGPGMQQPPAPERVRVSADGKGFELAPSGKKFTPWGFNYDHDEKSRLLEEYWDAEWATVEEDFREMKELGATVVRIHLQLARFLRDPEEANGKTLERFARLLELAEKTGLYLDLTGLCSYRKSDWPAWYVGTSEKERWAIQARFWEAVSSVGTKSSAVMAYNLMNEPVSPAGPGKEWHGGPPLGDFYYVENITREPGKRSREEVTREWMGTLIAAIRKHDTKALVTTGMFFIFEIPNGLTLGPNPSAIGEKLDYLSVHMYPKDASVPNSLKLLESLRAAGKPVILEEIFPLSCSMDSFRKFLAGSKDFASGWIGFYWGKTLEEYRRGKELKDAAMAAWLEFFRDSGPNFKDERR